MDKKNKQGISTMAKNSSRDFFEEIASILENARS